MKAYYEIEKLDNCQECEIVSCKCRNINMINRPQICPLKFQDDVLEEREDTKDLTDFESEILHRMDRFKFKLQSFVLIFIIIIIIFILCYAFLGGF